MTRKAPRRGATRLLNVDLELVTTRDIGVLLESWSRTTFALRDSTHHGRRTVWLELARDPADVEAAIRAFAGLVEALPARRRRLWNACDDRCLNVGIEGGATPHAAVFRISQRSVTALAAIATRLEFTVYAPDRRRRLRGA